MMYNEEIIRQVAEANDLVELISQYVTLKKSGHNYMGCCPFHNEKTPSFSVSAEKQMYHCFGCGVGGNIYTFVQQMENMGFLEALEYLADRAGIALPKQYDPIAEEGYRKKQRLWECHRLAANFYYKNLVKNPEAQRYLKERGFLVNTIRHFGLGVSTGHWNDLYKFLKSQSFSDDELLESGLVLQGDQGNYYDRFRNRIMIPILSVQDKVIGFGGREYLPSQGKGPKYLNSPETPVFSKSYELFNLNHAKRNIIDESFVITEGYMDVMALVQNGIPNCVAALGTAFTPYHVKTLSRYVKEVILCFDGDEAGKNATIKAITLLKNSALNVRIIRLDPADDPDSFIKSNGLYAFQEKIRQAMTVTEFELDCLQDQFDTGSNDGRVKYLNGVVNLLKDISNPMALELYVKKAAKEGDVSESVLMQEIQKRQRNQHQHKPTEFADSFQQNRKQIPKAYQDAQFYVLKQMLMDPDLAKDVLEETDFTAGSLRRIYQAIMAEAATDSVPISVPTLNLRLTNEMDQSVLSAIALKEEKPQELSECITCIKKYSGAKKDKQRLHSIQNDAVDDAEKLAMLNQLLQQHRKD